LDREFKQKKNVSALSGGKGKKNQIIIRDYNFSSELPECLVTGQIQWLKFLSKHVDELGFTRSKGLFSMLFFRMDVNGDLHVFSSREVDMEVDFSL
jgi:hypothetical protein